MLAGKTHPKEDLIRYADKALSKTESKEVAKHLETCDNCRQFLSFVKEFSGELANLKEEEFTTDEACPDSWTLVSYEAGDVDEETAKHMRVHLLFCDDCSEEFYALQRLRPKRVEATIRVAEGFIDCVQISDEATFYTEPTAVGAILGIGDVLEAPFLLIKMSMVDPDTGAESDITLRIEGEYYTSEKVLVNVKSSPVPEGLWQARLLDAPPVPITTSLVTVSKELEHGSYILGIYKEDECLGEFSFTVQRFNEPEAIKSSIKYLSIRDYPRALAILYSAFKWYPTSTEISDLLFLAIGISAEHREANERKQKKSKPRKTPTKQKR